MSSRERTARASSRDVFAVIGVLGPLAAVVIPFVGPVAALSTPVLAAVLGPRVWPTRPSRAAGWAILALIGFWMTASVVAVAIGISDVIAYLLIPLCAPVGSMGWIPAIAAIVAYAIGGAISVRTRHISLWPVAAVAAGLAYALAWGALEGSVQWIC